MIWLKESVKGGILKGMNLERRTKMTEKTEREIEEFRQRFIQEKGVIIIGIELSIKDLWILMFKVAIASIPIYLVFIFILALMV